MTSPTQPSFQPADAPAANWLHLDLKGANPSFEKLLDWLNFFAHCGFNGLVWEYENRYDWKSLPGTADEPYSASQWQAIWKRCEELGLHVTPLVQTHGHLEWLLKHEAYAAWREAGFYNEICPQNRQAVERIHLWLDEVIDLHPAARYIHIGGDETWKLCSCPSCQQTAAAHPHGRMGVYLDHVSSVCRHVLDRGRKPMIWADMFWREDRMDLAAVLPEGVALIDWRYVGSGPFFSTQTLARAGRELWGASGIRCAYDSTLLLSPLRTRLENIQGWNQQRQRGLVRGVIHTTWGRKRGLKPPYGPWIGWLPGFLQAGSQGRWTNHPLQAPMLLWETLLANPGHPDGPQIVRSLQSLAAAGMPGDPMAEQCLRWWSLAAEHLLLRQRVMHVGFDNASLATTQKHIGMAPEIFKRHGQFASQLDADLQEWETRARQFWKDQGLSNENEFFDSRSGYLRQFITPPWATHADR